MMAVMLGCAVGHTSRINFLTLPENVTWISATTIVVDLKNIFPSLGWQLLWLQLLLSAGKTSNEILFLLLLLCLSAKPFGEACIFSHFTFNIYLVFQRSIRVDTEIVIMYISDTRSNYTRKSHQFRLYIECNNHFVNLYKKH